MSAAMDGLIERLEEASRFPSVYQLDVLLADAATELRRVRDAPEVTLETRFDNWSPELAAIVGDAAGTWYIGQLVRIVPVGGDE